MKTFLKQIIAERIHQENANLVNLKRDCKTWYKLSTPDTQYGQGSFLILNHYRNEYRNSKKKMKTLEAMQRSIKALPDEYFESFLHPIPAEDSEGNVNIRAWFAGPDAHTAKDIFDWLAWEMHDKIKGEEQVAVTG